MVVLGFTGSGNAAETDSSRRTFPVKPARVINFDDDEPDARPGRRPKRCWLRSKLYREGEHRARIALKLRCVGAANLHSAQTRNATAAHDPQLPVKPKAHTGRQGPDIE